MSIDDDPPEPVTELEGVPEGMRGGVLLAEGVTLQSINGTRRNIERGIRMFTTRCKP